MNRFNFGNQTTNGMQILSVAGRTAAGDIIQSRQRKINDLSSGLNNLSEDEQRRYGKFRADKMRQQMNDFYGSEIDTSAGSENVYYSSRSSGGSSTAGSKPNPEEPQVKDIEIDESMISRKPNELSSPQEPIEAEWERVDDLSSIGFTDNSEQYEMLNMKARRDIAWLNRYTSNNENSEERRF